MILSDRDILQAVERGEITISPFLKEHVQSASIDLTLASMLRIFEKATIKYIDAREPLDVSTLVELDTSRGFIIHPGDFILGSTAELITLPNHLAARIEGRSSIGRLGVSIQASAGHVSPGFSGNITLEISNVSRIPVKLYPRMRIAQLIFESLSSPASNPYGSSNLKSKYHSQTGPTASRAWKDFETPPSNPNTGSPPEK
jgi:dCTP deaminase